MKVYKVVKHVKAENMYEAIQIERNFHPREIEELSTDNQPMGYHTDEQRK